MIRIEPISWPDEPQSTDELRISPLSVPIVPVAGPPIQLPDEDDFGTGEVLEENRPLEERDA
jgi:hypothetical protein